MFGKLWIGRIVVAIALCAAPAAFAGVTVIDGGVDGKPARISLHGPIVRGVARQLEQALDRVRGNVTAKVNGVPLITVELDSPGGDVVEAVEIGRTIYQNFVMTLVKPGHECVSACVFVLMAGAVHTPQDGADIGLHRPLLVSWRNMSSAEAHAKYDGLMAYLREYFAMLGVSDKAYDTMMDTSSYGMRYFSATELDKLRLRGEDPAWERFYRARWAAENAPPAPESPAQAQPPVRLAQLPKLPPVDESWRTIVFMPGAYHPGVDYYAGTYLPHDDFDWASMDGAWNPIFGPGPDLVAKLQWLMRALSSLLTPVWWFVALFIFELLRARPWPGDPVRRAGRADQWRLTELR